MNTTKPLHIFKPGRQTAMSGVTLEFSESDLEASARAYDPAKHEAPIVVGHPKHDAPAYGWVKSLAAGADGLNAEPHQVDANFAELVAAGRYKKISASFYLPDAPNNPVPGVYYLRHVGFLGAQPPAVKGLKQAEFADAEDGIVEFGDWGFGIIHEIGHVFSQGNISGTGRWNWNDEIFANFRMSYALEACDGTMSQRDICYRGADVINYYKIFYDETIGAGIPKNNGDALHYTFLRIKERYGWDVYKKAFRELYALGDSGQEGLETPYDKFLFFLSYVSKAAGEDVVAATYTPGELALIEESLRN